VSAGRAAVFLDRDGTLIEDPGYLADPAGVRVRPGVPEALRRLESAGFLLVVVTNQSGIGRGLHTEADYRAVNEAMFAALGVRFAGAYHCPHEPGDGCDCRKPAPGMLIAAAREHGIDLAASYLIGDAVTDAKAAIAAGCAPILLGSGPAPAGVWCAPDFAAAVDRILGAAG
jgi:D-glycero-D-manno-heptose 1,7-bisphosphate phosphatase